MLSKLHAQKPAQHCAVEVKVSCGGPIVRHYFVHLLIATRREGRRRDGGRDLATEGGKDGETKGGRRQRKGRRDPEITRTCTLVLLMVS